MKFNLLTILTLSLTIGLSPLILADESPMSLRSALEAHCIKCHGESGKANGNFDLLDLKADRDLLAKPELLEALQGALKDRLMPPEDEPPLPDAMRTQMLKQIEVMLRELQETHAFEPIPIRRMNRFQYNNAVVDLLELDRDIFALEERLLRRRDNYFRPETKKMPDKVKVTSRPLSKDIDNQRPEGFKDVASFPQDKRAEHGFDNRADHLTLSPLLMESFLKLSQTIVDSPDLNPKECRSWNWLFATPELPKGPAGEEAAKKEIHDRLKKLLRRAFRQPADADTFARFTEFAESQLATGATLEQTMRTIVGAVLGMPEFLYLYETPESRNYGPKNLLPANSVESENGRQRIDDFELATRLAQFFWSSIPDDALLDLAESNHLSDTNTLGAQIDRMMNDRRTSRFCDNFPAQWLQLDRLITSVPDPKSFSGFYHSDGYRMSLHMMSEPLLLFETVFIEDRSIVELLDANFTWQSSMLDAIYAGHFNADHQLQVQEFKRVELSDPRRGGVITNAAVMTMTATPTRTQPITRGAWVNAVIFNDPPEPPPADVPPLPEADHEELAKLTIRERLAAHRTRQDCAGCHNKIDPFGFALENFGPTGFWRDTYENGREVDVSGVLFNQHKFKTVVEFKQLILREKQRFIRGFTAHLLAYALGRQLGLADSPTLDDITAKAMDNQDQMRTVLKNIAMSEPFLHKNTLDATVKINDQRTRIRE